MPGRQAYNECMLEEKTLNRGGRTSDYIAVSVYSSVCNASNLIAPPCLPIWCYAIWVIHLQMYAALLKCGATVLAKFNVEPMYISSMLPDKSLILILLWWQSNSIPMLVLIRRECVAHGHCEWGPCHGQIPAGSWSWLPPAMLWQLLHCWWSERVTQGQPRAWVVWHEFAHQLWRVNIYRHLRAWITLYIALSFWFTGCFHSVIASLNSFWLMLP